MIVKLTDTGLLIEPETEFEEQYLSIKYRGTENIMVFLKTGLTPLDILGLKIDAVQK